MSDLWLHAVPNTAGYRDVPPREVAAAAAIGTIRVVDVREPDEFHGELGRILVAELCPLQRGAPSRRSRLTKCARSLCEHRSSVSPRRDRNVA